MGSRLRENPDKLFEVFAEVGRPEEVGSDPFILQKYPPDYDEQDVLNNIPKFSFPCRINTTQVDQFAFVLTDMESLYRFGFCRHGTGAQTCLCILSHLPWYEVFYKMLNFLAEIVNRSENNDLLPFLKAAYEQSIPLADEPVTIVAGQDMFNFTAPDSTCLPSIPASRNLTEYYNAVDPTNMMRIFASMLQERRIIVTSKKLSRVTACIHAAEALLYPMNWQHLYIPVLPEHLVDYVTAPMPYLIGVHTSLMEKILARRMEVGDSVIVDADKNEVTTEYEDLEAFPEDVSSYLKRHLKTQRVQTSMMDCGDAISRAFLQALVRLIGGYRDALKIRDNEPITFDREAFVQSRSSHSMQVFLENMLHLQIFQQFINDRLELLNEGGGLTELFELESVKYADSLNTQSKYKEWLARVSKQKRKIKAGGKDIISDMRERAAPMMNTAVQSMKMQGKKVMSKVKEINENKMSSRKVTGGIVHSRQRPSTIAGSHLTSTRPPRPAPSPSGSSQRPRTSMTGQTDRGQGYRSQLSVEDGSIDDSHLRLSYHSIDVSLMTDADIQNAMMRSASAEHLPVPDRSSPQSASEGDISSTPSSEALSPSDDNLADIPYLDMTSHPQDTIPLAPTSSSEEDLTRPPPLPPKDTGTGADRLIATDHLVTTDRLVTPNPSLPAPVAPPRTSRRLAESRSSGSSPQPSPQLPRPQATKLRRTSVEKVGASPAHTTTTTTTTTSTTPRSRAAEKPLIHFESSESEADGLEQFDPLHSKPPGRNSSASPSAEGADTSPPLSSRGLSRNRSSRNSLMRSAAFRKAPGDAPVRAGYREDESTLEDEKGGKVKVADLFDPLATLSLTNPAFSSANTGDAHTTRSGQKGGGGGSGGGVGSGGEAAGSGSLIQDWTLDHLAAGSGLTPSARPPSGGGGQFSTPAFGTQFPPPSGSRPFSRPPSSSSTGPGFSRVPSGGTLTCPPTAVAAPPSPFPPTSLTSNNPLYVAPTTTSVQSNPLYQPAPPSSSSTPQPGSRGMVQSNPLYQLARSSVPKPATHSQPLHTWSSSSTSTSTSPRPRHSQGPPGGPSGQGSASQGRLQSTKGVDGGGGGGVSALNPAQAKPPPARRWETFD